MKNRFANEIIVVIVILAVTVVTVLFVQALATEYARKAPVEQEISTQTAVYLMRDTTGVSGSFFLGTGMLHDTLQYVAYDRSPSGNPVHHRTGRSDECPTVCTLTTVYGDSTTNSFWLLRISGTLC